MPSAERYDLIDGILSARSAHLLANDRRRRRRGQKVLDSRGNTGVSSEPFADAVDVIAADLEGISTWAAVVPTPALRADVCRPHCPSKKMKPSSSHDVTGLRNVADCPMLSEIYRVNQARRPRVILGSPPQPSPLRRGLQELHYEVIRRSPRNLLNPNPTNASPVPSHGPTSRDWRRVQEAGYPCSTATLPAASSPFTAVFRPGLHNA